MKWLSTTLLCCLFSITTSIGQNIGIQMGSARAYMENGVEEGLIKLKEMGIKYIEGAGSRSMSNAEYKKLLDKHGFDVVAAGVNFDQIANTDSTKALIQNLKFFDVEYAVCYWIPHDGDNFVFADMEKAVSVFNKAGKQFADAGISFVYHPHGYEFRPYIGAGTMFDYMMEKTDPKYVNFQIDVFWIRNPGQNPAALMRKYPTRFPLTHLKDRMIGSVDNLNGRQDKERNVVLGLGDVNIAEVMKASKEIGVKYHFIEDESSRAMVQVPQSLEYLRSLNYETQALELSVEALRRAMVNGDSLALRSLTSERLTYGHSSGKIEDRESFVTSLVTKTSDFESIILSDQEVSVEGDVAWVRHILKGNTLDTGKPSPVNLKILLIWTKEGGIWKLLARQAVRNT
ncbi:MAG: TIM barrel protein [Saprospiraceae bacterium]|nr:TIM barrel protein [Saprospiraceae bacterium]